MSREHGSYADCLLVVLRGFNHARSSGKVRSAFFLSTSSTSSAAGSVLSPSRIPAASTMNYAGAAGLEFGRDSPALDPNVLQHLPEDCTVLSTAAHGVSFWASVGRINVCLNNGMEQAYFIKVVSQDIGKAMIMSEFESLSAIYQVTPISVPKPMAWGSYKTRADTYFLLCKFYHLSDPETLPDTHNFASLLSTLHQKSKSPNGKFGFHLITYPGNLPQWTGWEDSWEVFFTKSMRQALDLEVERKGPSEELHALSRVLFDRVIPRLLRPLESDGRSVKPSLVHGDLWYANAGTDINTGQCLVFDPCCFYAHNECKYLHAICSPLNLDLMLTSNKMSLDNGARLVTSLGLNTLLPITLLSIFHTHTKTL